MIKIDHDAVQPERMRFELERKWIDRRNALIQDKRVRRPGEVYDQVNEDIRDVLEKYGTDLNELLSKSRTRNASRARAEVCMIALERLRPLGISDCDIAKFIGIQRTTMLFSAKRWKRDNGET